MNILDGFSSQMSSVGSVVPDLAGMAGRIIAIIVIALLAIIALRITWWVVKKVFGFVINFDFKFSLPKMSRPTSKGPIAKGAYHTVSGVRFEPKPEPDLSKVEKVYCYHTHLEQFTHEKELGKYDKLDELELATKEANAKDSEAQLIYDELGRKLNMDRIRHLVHKGSITLKSVRDLKRGYCRFDPESETLVYFGRPQFR